MNKLFEPWDQVHESQHHLLAIALQTAMGGIHSAHVGSGGGNSTSDLPWRAPNEDDRSFAFRCMQQVHHMLNPAPTHAVRRGR